MLIVTSIIYNICNFPQKIKTIIDKYNGVISKIIKNKIKSSQKKSDKYNINIEIEIKDCFDDDINKFGEDFYLLFESDKLINDNIKKDNDINISLNNNNYDREKKELTLFLKIFKLFLKMKKKLKKCLFLNYYYINT